MTPLTTRGALTNCRARVLLDSIAQKHRSIFERKNDMLGRDDPLILSLLSTCSTQRKILCPMRLTFVWLAACSDE